MQAGLGRRVNRDGDGGRVSLRWRAKQGDESRRQNVEHDIAYGGTGEEYIVQVWEKTEGENAKSPKSGERVREMAREHAAAIRGHIFRKMEAQEDVWGAAPVLVAAAGWMQFERVTQLDRDHYARGRANRSSSQTSSFLIACFTSSTIV